MRKKIFIHIGYPKTGTTTIQKHFFPKIEEVQYIHKLDSLRTDLYKKIIEELVNKKNSEIDFYNLEGELAKKLTKDTIVLSSENFLFNAFIPEKFYNKVVTPSPLAIACNLRDLFDEKKYDVKVIVVIRKQDEMITSIYGQVYTNTYSNFKEYNTFKKYLKVFTAAKYKKHVFRRALNYNHIVSNYQSLLEWIIFLF